MTPNEFSKLLDKYTRGECSEAEEKVVLQWYENIDLAQSGDVSHKEVRARLWSKIRPEARGTRPTRFIFYLSAAAALLLLAAVSIGLYYNNRHLPSRSPEQARSETRGADTGAFTHEINRGKATRTILLADGSSVKLKPGSELRFAKTFAPGKREVYLTGEAFFNVRRDRSRPFFVYSNEVVTRVLGTSFNIKAYAEDKEVTVAVKTGRVSVYANRDKEPAKSGRPAKGEVILTPNHQVVYNRRNDQVYKQLVEVPEIILQQPTLFQMQYDGVAVADIFQALEENYGVDIWYDEAMLKNCVLTTTLSDEGFYERIEIICKAIGAEYSVTDAVVQIKSRGCL
jgi:transmembrane sensor